MSERRIRIDEADITTLRDALDSATRKYRAWLTLIHTSGSEIELANLRIEGLRRIRASLDENDE